MPDLDIPTVIIVTVIVILIGVFVYGRIFAARNAKNLEDMIGEHGVTPDAVLKSEASDVALCWLESDTSFVYVNTISGTNRRIPADEISALDVLENSLTVRHQENPFGKKDIAEDIADGVGRLLGAQDVVERLEILLKTKTGGPPMGYSIPLVESETPAGSAKYKQLRNELVNTVQNWRSVIGLT